MSKTTQRWSSQLNLNKHQVLEWTSNVSKTEIPVLLPTTAIAPIVMKNLQQLFEVLHEKCGIFPPCKNAKMFRATIYAL